MAKQVKLPDGPRWRSAHSLLPDTDVPAGAGPTTREVPLWVWTVSAVALAVAVTWLAVATFAGRPVNLNDRPLTVGDCASGVPFDGTDVSAVELVECAELHDVEVYAITVVRGEGPWPGDGEVNARAMQACRVAAAGELSNLDPGWALKFLRPTADGWNAGDRGVTCLVTRASGNQTAGSVTR